MKIHSVKTLLIISLLTSLLILVSSCSKKVVESPTAGPGSSSLSGGTDINYPPAETGYSETNMPAEGTLDDTAVVQEGNQQGNLSVNMNETNTSDEYKKEHGRSSVGLSPIYFNFDQAGIRPDMADRMANNALFLKQLPDAKVIVEGNCDNRGTNEYNLALGERRALNAKDYLINLGVEAYRIRTVSYGEERPLFPGQDEFSHSQNRRDDFILE